MDIVYLVLVLVIVCLLIDVAVLLRVKDKLNDSKDVGELDKVFHCKILLFFRHFGVHVYSDIAYQKLQELVSEKQNSLVHSTDLFAWIEVYEEISKSSFLKNDANAREETLRTFIEKILQLISDELRIFRSKSQNRESGCKEIKEFSLKVDGFLLSTKDLPRTKQLSAFIKSEINEQCDP